MSVVNFNRLIGQVARDAERVPPNTAKGAIPRGGRVAATGAPSQADDVAALKASRARNATPSTPLPAPDAPREPGLLLSTWQRTMGWLGKQNDLAVARVIPDDPPRTVYRVARKEPKSGDYDYAYTNVSDAHDLLAKKGDGYRIYRGVTEADGAGTAVRSPRMARGILLVTGYRWSPH